jgi:hypothetical protein
LVGAHFSNTHVEEQIMAFGHWFYMIYCFRPSMSSDTSTGCSDLGSRVSAADGSGEASLSLLEVDDVPDGVEVLQGLNISF